MVDKGRKHLLLYKSPGLKLHTVLGDTGLICVNTGYVASGAWLGVSVGPLTFKELISSTNSPSLMTH